MGWSWDARVMGVVAGILPKHFELVHLLQQCCCSMCCRPHLILFKIGSGCGLHVRFQAQRVLGCCRGCSITSNDEMIVVVIVVRLAKYVLGIVKDPKPVKRAPRTSSQVSCLDLCASGSFINSSR